MSLLGEGEEKNMADGASIGTTQADVTVMPPDRSGTLFRRKQPSQRPGFKTTTQNRALHS